MIRLMIIAGETSGDIHAASLVHAIQKQRPDIAWFGIGGPHMRNAGVETFHDVSEMAVLGLAEVLKRYGFFKRVFRETLALIDARQPDAVILVDYPGFNLRLAQKLHDRGIRVIYYICPQVWAWHRERIPKMARILDRLITIFPFEAEHFSGTNLPVSYVGHPLVDTARKARALPAITLPWQGRKRVALLPGSRIQEINRLLPIMLKTAARLESDDPDINFIVAAYGESEAGRIHEILHRIRGPKRCDIVTGRTRQLLRQADAALVASGTATLETALMRCPMVVAYKVNPLTYFAGKLLIRIQHIGMVNIVAGREVCPEFIQYAATPGALAAALRPLISDTPQRQTMLTDLNAVAETLGDGGAAERAADVVLHDVQD